MRTVIKNIPATRVAEELARRGLDPDRKVTVVEESLSDLARQIGEEAEANGMTDQILANIFEFKPSEFENIFGRPRSDKPLSNV